MHASPLEGWHAAHHAVLADAEPARYGDLARELDAIRTSAALFDHSARDRLLVTGNDRVELVQGLTTNDVEQLAVGASLETAFITPKGKLVADARVTKLDDALLFDTETGRGAALEELLTKYVLHEDVTVQDVSGDLAQLELWGPRAAELLGATLTDGTSGAVEVGGVAFLAVGTVFGAIGFVPAGAAEDVATDLAGRLDAIGGTLAGREAVEIRRIELGIGRYGRDWDESTNPLEAGLDRAISYKKGCYVGQEVVAKATYIGRVNRRLVRLEWPGDAVAHDTPILGGKSPGRVTSSARRPDGVTVGLGYVRRETEVPGGQLQIGENGPTATVTGWPHGSKDKPV